MRNISKFNDYEKNNEEFFGGSKGEEGVVIIELGGDGELKDIVDQKIKELLRTIGGEIHPLVDGEEIDIHK